jgi:dCTP diphosphatase
MALWQVEYFFRMLESIAELAARLHDFATERDWEQFHTPKNLAMALAGEAGELLAEFQWLTPEESRSLTGEAKAKVAAEIADVFNYLVRLADVLDLDLLTEAEKKMTNNAKRYPIDQCRGSAHKAPPLSLVTPICCGTDGLPNTDHLGHRTCPPPHEFSRASKGTVHDGCAAHACPSTRHRCR